MINEAYVEDLEARLSWIKATIISRGCAANLQEILKVAEGSMQWEPVKIVPGKGKERVKSGTTQKGNGQGQVVL